MDRLAKPSWWVRHAPTQDGAGRIVGWTNLSADLTNDEDVATAAAKLPEDAVWFCSSLARAQETAIALRDRRGVAAPLITSELVREQNFGAWEGRRWDEIDANGFWDDPANSAPPAGESFTDVVRRTSLFLDDLRAQTNARPAIVVTHAGPIRAAIGLSKGLSVDAMLDLPVDFLSVNEVAL